LTATARERRDQDALPRSLFIQMILAQPQRMRCNGRASKR